MPYLSEGLLMREGEPIRIPPRLECVISRETLSMKKDGVPLIGYMGEEFKKNFLNHKEIASPEMTIQGYRLLKDSNPSRILEEFGGKHYLCSMGTIVFLLEEEAGGRDWLDTTGRANTFFVQSRKGVRTVDLVRTGSSWRVIANPVHFSGDTNFISYRAGRMIFLPDA